MAEQAIMCSARTIGRIAVYLSHLYGNGVNLMPGTIPIFGKEPEKLTAKEIYEKLYDLNFEAYNHTNDTLVSGNIQDFDSLGIDTIPSEILGDELYVNLTCFQLQMKIARDAGTGSLEIFHRPYILMMEAKNRLCSDVSITVNNNDIFLNGYWG